MKDNRQSRQRMGPSTKTAARWPAASSSRSLIGLLLAAGVVLGCSVRPPPAAQVAFLRAEEHHDAYELEEAISAYTEAIELHPTFAEAYHRRGVARMRSAAYDEAAMIEDQTKAIALKPGYAEAYFERGVARGGRPGSQQTAAEAKGDAERAIMDYTKAIELRPDYAAAYWFRAVCYEVVGDEGQAKRDYQQAMKIDPNLWGGFPVP